MIAQLWKMQISVINKAKSFSFFLFFFIIRLFSPVSAYPQAEYSIVIDRNLSSIVAGQNLLTFHKCIYEAENFYFKTSIFEENTFARKSAGIAYRLGKTILLDNIIDHMTGLIQHEVFGHGARYRELGYTNSSYTLNLFFPYGKGNGMAISGNPPDGRIISKHERILKTQGENEATGILAAKLTQNWLNRESINYRECGLFLGSFHNLTSYIVFTKYQKSISYSNDIGSYIFEINSNEGQFSNGTYYNIDKLIKYSALNLFNTFQYFAAYTYLKSYLWSGQENFDFPMIKMASVKYLPSFRFGLSPFGAEFYSDHFLKFNKKLFSVYGRYGEPTFHKFWGIGVNASDFFDFKFIKISAKADLWQQPEVWLGGKELSSQKNHFGYSISNTLKFKFSNNNYPLTLSVQYGYKSAGFIMGETLNKGFILRAGISFTEKNKKSSDQTGS